MVFPPLDWTVSSGRHFQWMAKFAPLQPYSLGQSSKSGFSIIWIVPLACSFGVC